MKSPMRGLAWLAVALAVAWPAAAEMATLRVGTPPGRMLASARPAPKRPKPPTAYVARAAGAVQVDGRLDEKAWKGATRLSLARTLDGAGPASQPTAVLLLRDGETLLVGFRCAEPRMDRIRPGKTGTDLALWEDDSVEVFLGTEGGYVHLGVNVAGGTVDGRGKSDTWNLPLRARTARGKDHWTAEMAVPLAKVAGGRPPKQWIANFNRTRYGSGAGEEFAWSPTFSGDSHAPARFGRLVLADPPPRQAEKDAPDAGPVEVVAVSSGVAVVRLNLSALPKGAKVHRADLRLFRRPVGADEALVRVEVYPLAKGFAEGAQPKASGKPMALRGPRFDRLDATAAVRAWAAGRGGARRLDLFVKTAPPLQLDHTCLDILYEGKPKGLPAQASGLAAFHRAGQTFLTWKDREDAFGDRPVTWGEMRKYFQEADAQRQVRYRLYRHSRRIDAASVSGAELLAEVAPLSGLNANSWSLERLVNQVVFGNADQGELGKYGPFSGWSRSSPEGGRLIIPRLAIHDGRALPPGTALYVHSASAGGRAYYAVTLAANGVENLSAFSPANSLARPVAETAAAWRVGAAAKPGTAGPQPVEQPAGKGFGFDYRGRRHFYVTWAAPPLAPRPMYFNWSVLVPPEAKAPAPVELYFHGPGTSYARPPVKFLDRSIQICPHDEPFSGWYGTNDAAGTLKSPADGVVRPYTIRRVEAFLAWARGKFPIDAGRIVPVGGDGAGLMALYRPELFAYVLITGFQSRQLDPKAAGDYTRAWGPRSEQVRNDAGLSDWAWGELDCVLAGRRLANVRGKDDARPTVPAGAAGHKVELPLFICNGNSWGRDSGYARGWGRFYYALQGTRHGMHGCWGWNRPTYPGKFDGLWRGLDLTNATPFVAITNASTDGEGESRGNANRHHIWTDLTETPEAFGVTIVGPESTFDLTPRRLSRFKVAAGQTVAWEATPVAVKTYSRAAKPDPQSGKVTAGAGGVITLTGLKLPRGWSLKVRIGRLK